MSSPSRTPSETTALLIDSRPASLPGRNSQRGCFKFSREAPLIPVTLATSLAAGMTSTTLVELVRQAVCRLWNILHGDPVAFSIGGPSPPERCDAPEVARYFAIVLAVLGATESIISIAGFGIFSRISSRYGRKPAFLLILLGAVMSRSIIAGSQHMPDWLTSWVFLAGILCGVFSAHLHYLIDMYIIDGCAPEDRTAALSKIAGWAGLGICTSFALGGSVTTNTGNPVIVFYAATAIYGATFIYVASFLPESFPEDKRNALSRMCAESSSDRPSTTTRFAALQIFEPLKMLIPTRESGGTRNWRLARCAAHTFLFTLAESYAPSAWLVLATSKRHLTPADTGIFFTVMSVSSTISLMVIVPRLVRFLRPYYRRKTVRPVDEEEDLSTARGLESETSDRLHVHLAVVSCVVGAFSSLSAAASTTSRAFILSAICIGFSFIRGPTIRSLVAGSVDPLKQGEALAAIGMVANAGSVLSPIVMGSILTATIGTTPLLMFYIQMVIILISSSMLFLVRDADRYQKPDET